MEDMPGSKVVACLTLRTTTWNLKTTTTTKTKAQTWHRAISSDWFAGILSQSSCCGSSSAPASRGFWPQNAHILRDTQKDRYWQPGLRSQAGYIQGNEEEGEQRNSNLQGTTKIILTGGKRRWQRKEACLGETCTRECFLQSALPCARDAGFPSFLLNATTSILRLKAPGSGLITAISVELPDTVL